MHLSVTETYTCAHFCYKMLHCGIWHRCILGFVRWVYTDLMQVLEITLWGSQGTADLALSISWLLMTWAHAYVNIRSATIQFSHYAIRIMIQSSQYDTYPDICINHMLFLDILQFAVNCLCKIKYIIWSWYISWFSCLFHDRYLDCCTSAQNTWCIFVPLVNIMFSYLLVHTAYHHSLEKHIKPHRVCSNGYNFMGHRHPGPCLNI